MLQFHKNYELRLKVEGIQQEELKYLFRQKRFPQTISAMRFGMVKKAAKQGYLETKTCLEYTYKSSSLNL